MIENAETEHETNYRQFNSSSQQIREFYKLNHQNQTLDFVLRKKKEYLPLTRSKMSIWEAMKTLDTVIDESDPDLKLPQSHHFFQTAEALRKAMQPRWLILTGLIHDLGKILVTYGEPSWSVVGDTFPVGCAYKDSIVFSEFFAQNPDSNNKAYQTINGIYKFGCGLDNVHLSWSHDCYLYHVVKDYLPQEASYIIRYHSFYAMHTEGDYQYLLNDYDRSMIGWLRLFSSYDLYSKSETMVDVEPLRSYYEELVDEFLPNKLNW